VEERVAMMNRLFVGLLAIGVVGGTGGLGAGVAEADLTYSADEHRAATPPPAGGAPAGDIVYAVGGARAPGIPWYDYTQRAGAAYFPDAQRTVVDYPAGAAFNWLPDFLLPQSGREPGSIGQSVTVAANHLDADIRRKTAPAAAVGLSQGTMGLDLEQARLADDRSAPPPETLSFTDFANPTGRNAFGASFLAHFFAPGTYIPYVDYTMPTPVDSQYDSTDVVAAYDGISDFPDRLDNPVSVANAAAGAAIAHTATAFTSPSDVPPQNIRTTVNAKGATTRTYLIPLNHLPLTMPLRELGMSDGFVDQIDSVLQPIVDAGYSRNDDPATKPVSVDPQHGMDPVAVLGSVGAHDDIDRTVDTIRNLIPSIG
jgi:hypothetical protein